MNARAATRDRGEVSALRIPPHSEEAEQAVLGGLLLSPAAWPDVADVLTEGDFYRRAHQLIWRAIAEEAEQNRPFDAVTLGNWFEDRDLASQVANGAYLTELATTTPSAANIRAYAEIVRAKAILRQLITVGTEIANEGFEATTDDADEIVASAAAKVAAMTQHTVRTGGLVPVRAGLDAAWRDLEARYAGEGDLGLPLPWANLRRKIPGIEDTDLVVLAARPSMGKTAAALAIAYHAAASRKAVAIFSLEMGKQQLVTRLLAMRALVDMQRMRERRGLTDEDWEALSEARRHLAELPLAIDDDASLSVDALRARAARMHRKVEGGLGLIVVDYLQLLSGGQKFDSRTEEVSYISRSLKKLAKDLRCPVLALSQLNRSLETRVDKRPVMADLRESGAIEQDADIVAFLFRDDYYTKDACGAPGISELIVAKNRQGATGTAYLKHQLECSAFHDYYGPKPDYRTVTAVGAAGMVGDGFDDEPAPTRRRRAGRSAAAGPDA